MSEPTITKVRLTVAETAAEIRKVLKVEFPGQKFSVRSKSYAGGASVHIDWEDGPAEPDVKARTERFAGATFDGMTDMQSYKDSVLLANEDGTYEDISYGADYVSCQRSVSEQSRARYHAEIVALLGQEFREQDRIPVHVLPDGSILPLRGSDEWGSTVIHRMSCARAKHGEPVSPERAAKAADLRLIVHGGYDPELWSNDELLALGIGYGVAGPLSDDQVMREAAERLAEIEGAS